MEPMTTLSEVINKLAAEGYTVDFNYKRSDEPSHKNLLFLHPEAFVIDKHYRFEGESDPEDEAVVYAISSPEQNIKGILVNGYGTSSDPLTNKILDVLKEKNT